MSVLMCLVLSLVAGRVAPASVDERTHGVPFSACPPCTTPFVPVALGLSFVGSDNVTLTGVVSGVAGWPGAPAGSLRIVCGSAVLNGTHPVVLESAGPRPTTSRIFNENHPSRSGGFLADNVVWMSPSAQSALSGEGLLFKSAGRYDEHNPPLSDDGPAPGPGKCGGFELNIYWNGMQYVLQRFNAEEQRIDIESRGTLSFGVSSANSSNCASLELKKEMIDISLVVGHQVLASGSLATVGGLPGLPVGSRLAIAGNLQLDESVARGGPRSYNLVPLGPLQNYSPLYYHTYNGFWFFNNLVHEKEPRIDTSGLVFSGAGNAFELSLYFQNEVGITCDGTKNPPECRHVKDGHGYAVWLYEAAMDRLHKKTFGNLVIAPRRTCSVSRPLELPRAQQTPAAERQPQPSESASGSTGVAAVATAVAVALAATVYWTPVLSLLRHVGLTGASDTGDCSNALAPCATLAYAVSRALDSDQVVIADNEYIFPASGPLVNTTHLSGKTLTIRGATKGAATFRGDTVGGVTTTILDWATSVQWSAASITFQNLVFSNGQTSADKFLVRLAGGTGGAFGSLQFIDCKFVNLKVNSPTSGGGLIRVDSFADVALTFQDTVFENIGPVTVGKAGSAIVWGPVSAAATLRVLGPTTTAASPTSVFKQCRSRLGGAISLQGTWGTLVDVRDTLFDGNIADEAGGAISTLSPLPGGGASNVLTVVGCTFSNNVQGTLQTTDATDLGGAAMAVSQGSVTVTAGATAARVCLFSGNEFRASPTTASTTRGGSAIRVTAQPLDGDAAPLTGFNVTRCLFQSNSVTTLFSNGAPIFFVGTSAEVNAMTNAPFFSGNTFVSNVVADATTSAAGIFYSVPDAAPTAARGANVQTSSFSSTAPNYDIVLGGGGMQFSGSNGNNVVGRMRAAGTSTFFVASGSSLVLIPPLRTDSLLIGQMNNAGTIRFSEISEVNAAGGTLTSSGTLYVSRNVTMTASLVLTPLSVLQFGVRSAVDYGVLTVVGSVNAQGSVALVSEDGFFAPPDSTPTTLRVLRATSLTGQFSSSQCLQGSQCSLQADATGVTVTNTAAPSAVNVGAIVGGVIGGVVALALIVLIVVFCVMRKKKAVKRNVELPNPAFEMRPDEGNRSPKSINSVEKGRTGSVSGDPTANATLNRIAATSPSSNSTM